MEDLGEASYILRVKIYRDKSQRLLILSQSGYIDKVLKRFGMQDSKRCFLPMSHGIKLSKSQCPTKLSNLDWIEFLLCACCEQKHYFSFLFRHGWISLYY